ncbi:FUSC family protein [Agarivorans sp. Alg241-V36]|uniref:FUSC family protein n=1 Tax=Agarivorans sp. Alg241-V36 TaxID=2305992 RepID=UPI0013D3F807|nr:FUSC family protein [Agarivorans sp. Alg241-V36]
MNAASIKAIKVAASLSLTIVLALSFGWEKPYWGAIAVIVMATTESYSHALHKARQRVIGTASGVVLGFTLLALFGQQRELFLLSELVLGGLAAYMSARSRYAYVYKMSFIVAIIVALASGLSESLSFSLAVLRVQETLLGVVCYSLVFSLLWPELKDPKALPKQVIRTKQEGGLRAFKFVAVTLVSWSLWIYLPIPGGFMFPLIAATLGLSLIEFPYHYLNKILGLVYVWSAVVLSQYVFVLPLLDSVWQLGAFYFVNVFLVWHFFPKENQLPMRILGGQFLVLLTMNAQHLRPIFDINSSLQMLLFLSLILITVRFVVHLVETFMASDAELLHE